MAIEPILQVGNGMIILGDVRRNGGNPHQPKQHVEIKTLFLCARDSGRNATICATGTVGGQGSIGKKRCHTNGNRGKQDEFLFHAAHYITKDALFAAHHETNWCD